MYDLHLCFFDIIEIQMLGIEISILGISDNML